MDAPDEDNGQISPRAHVLEQDACAEGSVVCPWPLTAYLGILSGSAASPCHDGKSTLEGESPLPGYALRN
jgi:hypothetical protein